MSKLITTLAFIESKERELECIIHPSYFPFQKTRRILASQTCLWRPRGEAPSQADIILLAKYTGSSRTTADHVPLPLYMLKRPGSIAVSIQRFESKRKMLGRGNWWAYAVSFVGLGDEGVHAGERA